MSNEWIFDFYSETFFSDIFWRIRKILLPV